MSKKYEVHWVSSGGTAQWEEKPSKTEAFAVAETLGEYTDAIKIRVLVQIDPPQDGAK